KTNVRMIEKWERRRGKRLPTSLRQLPASLREWYSLEGAEERLLVEEENFSTFSLQSALKGIRKVASTPPTNGFLVGFWEAGAGCYARCDGSEDPFVDNTYESSGHTFSAFALRRVWSKLTHSAEAESWGFFRDEVSAEF